MDPNDLRKWMDFYSQSMPFQDYSNGHDGGAGQANFLGNRLNFAMKMMGGNQNGGTQERMPDYFGGGQSGGQAPYSQPTYQAPQRFTMDQPPAAVYPAASPSAGASRNVLASVMKRYG